MKGRKRHLLVDTGGLVVKTLVHAANVTDRLGGQRLLEAIPHLGEVLPRRRHLWVDSASQESFKTWVEQALVWTVAAAPQSPARWRRWVVERTLGWLGRWRRTSKDYAYVPTPSACGISLPMTRVMLRRLADG